MRLFAVLGFSTLDRCSFRVAVRMEVFCAVLVVLAGLASENVVQAAQGGPPPLINPDQDPFVARFLSSHPYFARARGQRVLSSHPLQLDSRSRRQPKRWRRESESSTGA